MALCDFNMSTMLPTIFPDWEKANEYIQPASIDIPIGNISFMINQTSIPHDVNMHIWIDQVRLDKQRGPRTLFKGNTYLFKSQQIYIPHGCTGIFSPKSSLGRIDVHVRAWMVHDGGKPHELWDTIESGFSGQIWLMVTPKSFNIKVSPTSSVTQLMIKTNNTPYETPPVEILRINNNVAYYTPKFTNSIIDIDANNYNPDEFFIKHEDNGDPITIHKDIFYILSTTPTCSMRPNHVGEIRPYTHTIGEFRCHYAGLIDPGFGYPNPSAITLELRSSETIQLFHNQPIAMVDRIEMHSRPKQIYDTTNNHYYNQQETRLAKYFQQKC